MRQLGGDANSAAVDNTASNMLQRITDAAGPADGHPVAGEPSRKGSTGPGVAPAGDAAVSADEAAGPSSGAAAAAPSAKATEFEREVIAAARRYTGAGGEATDSASGLTAAIG